MIDPLDALAFYAVFVFAVTAHEAAHAWAAKLGGDLTAYHGGQVSLDPIPHMKREPIGMVVLPLITVSTLGWPIGYASAPYDPGWAQRHPRRAAWMALAGPGANLAMVLIAGLVIRAALGLGILEAPDSVHFTQVVIASAQAGETGLIGGVAYLLSIFFSLNLLLFVLNMMPLPPLDGSGALPLLLPDSWIARYQGIVHQPMLGLVGIVIVFNAFGEIFQPFFLLSIGLLYPDLSYG